MRLGAGHARIASTRSTSPGAERHRSKVMVMRVGGKGCLVALV